MITVEQTPLDGVLVVKPKVFADERGFFMETFNAHDFEAAGLPTHFVQDNHSRSSYGVLRGLHFQNPSWQGKLVRAIAGEIFDVAVDIRPESPTYGQWYGINLSAENKYQLYVPERFAHGFCVITEIAEVVYKCTSMYSPKDEQSLLWNDPNLAIEWPVDEPIISAKDADGLPLSKLRL